MKEEKEYKKLANELQEITKLCYFKSKHWEIKYQNWVFIKQGKLNKRFAQVIVIVSILLIIISIITVLKEGSAYDKFIKIGKLCEFTISLAFYSCDLLFLSTPALSRFHGTISAMAPYAVGIFRLFYHSTISIQHTYIYIIYICIY